MAAGPPPTDLLPVPAEALLRELDRLEISYSLHRHDPVFTVAESIHLKMEIPGLHCRNLFLRDKKGAFYLIVAANETKIDLRGLQARLGAQRLSFGSADDLWRLLGVRPGSVCPFAIINDKNRNNVSIVLDRVMMDAPLVNYHPMENHLTIGLSPAGLLKFVASCGHAPHIMDLNEARAGEA